MTNHFKRRIFAAAIVAALFTISTHASSDDTTRDLDATGAPIRPAAVDPVIAHVLQQISSQQIQHTIETLVSFHTRNTLSNMEKDLPAGKGVRTAHD